MSISRINPDDRRANAYKRRISAAELAADPARRPGAAAHDNGDNGHFAARPMAFAKGLLHGPMGDVGAADLGALISGLTQPSPTAPASEFSPRLNVRTAQSRNAQTRCAPRSPSDPAFGFRHWESPFAGHYYEIEGPDPHGVAMAPAPRLGESELSAEIAEVYAMAVVRDMSMEELGDPTAELYRIDPAGGDRVYFTLGPRPATVADLTAALGATAWLDPDGAPSGGLQAPRGAAHLSKLEMRRRQARRAGAGPLDAATVFRGSTPGCRDGGYISQFLLIGAPTAATGEIAFGAQSIDQKTRRTRPGLDYMTSWAEWLDVQNGVDLGGLDVAEGRTFIRTPRDMATYVHFDQLYQAYFNACLILLDARVPGDRGFPNAADSPNNRPHATRTGFATFGGPHVLSLMTEVATRALRAVRRQKFQVHLRARPERLAALITLAANDEWTAIGDARPQMERLLADLGLGADASPIRALMGWVAEINAAQNDAGAVNLRKYACIPITTDWRPAADRNYLLPMAFPEGSPMHPAYGAGHAAVAGACVTMLKAFFQLHDDAPTGGGAPAPLDFSVIAPRLMRVGVDCTTLQNAAPATSATIVGELNKLASNIAIGRNFAGVHYYTDYYDSLRMGERIAYGILQEQLLTYNEPVALSFPSFDDDWIEMSTTGGDTPGAVTTTIADASGASVSEADWWRREVGEF